VAHLRNPLIMPCQTSRRMILTSCSGILAKSAWKRLRVSEVANDLNAGALPT
jgi:hypothetical protein